MPDARGSVEQSLVPVALPYVSMRELAVRLLLDETAERREHLVAMPMRLRGSVAFRANRDA